MASKHKTNSGRDQNCGYQTQGEGELDESGQEVQTSSYNEISKSWGWNVQYGDYS